MRTNSKMEALALVHGEITQNLQSDNVKCMHCGKQHRVTWHVSLSSAAKLHSSTSERPGSGLRPHIVCVHW